MRSDWPDSGHQRRADVSLGWPSWPAAGMALWFSYIFKAYAWQPGAGRETAWSQCRKHVALMHVGDILDHPGLKGCPGVHVGPGWAHLGPILGLCWTYVGLCWRYVRPMLAYVSPILAYVGPVLQEVIVSEHHARVNNNNSQKWETSEDMRHI